MKLLGVFAGMILASTIGAHLVPDASFPFIFGVCAPAAFFGYCFGACAEGHRP